MDASTDADGIAEFELPPGQYVLIAYGRAGAAVEGIEVPAAADNDTAPIEVKIAVQPRPRTGP